MTQRSMLRGLWPAEGGDPIDLEIRDGRISSISPASSRREPGDWSFGDAIVSPGLINSHEHLEFTAFSHRRGGPYPSSREWADDLPRLYGELIDRTRNIPRSLRSALGVFKNLFGGVTTVVHHGSPVAHPTADLGTVIAGPQSIHSLEFDRKWRRRLLRPQFVRPAVIHVGEGVTELCRDELFRLARWNLWRRPLIAVHAIGMPRKVARRYRAVIWCPVSNFNLYGRSLDPREIEGETTVLFGTDSTLTAGWDALEHLSFAHQLGQLSAPELFASASTSPAQVWKLDQGRLEVGRPADLIVLRRRSDSPLDDLLSSHAGELLLVLSEGRVALVDATISAPSGMEPLLIRDALKRVPASAIGLLSELRGHGAEPGVDWAIPPH